MSTHVIPNPMRQQLLDSWAEAHDGPMALSPLLRLARDYKAAVLNESQLLRLGVRDARATAELNLCSAILKQLSAGNYNYLRDLAGAFEHEPESNERQMQVIDAFAHCCERDGSPPTLAQVCAQVAETQQTCSAVPRIEMEPRTIRDIAQRLELPIRADKRGRPAVKEKRK